LFRQVIPAGVVCSGDTSDGIICGSKGKADPVSQNKEGVLWIRNVTAAVNAVNCAGVKWGKKIPVKNRRRGKNNRPVCRYA
jgi:hypothetical protein